MKKGESLNGSIYASVTLCATAHGWKAVVVHEHGSATVEDVDLVVLLQMVHKVLSKFDA